MPVLAKPRHERFAFFVANGASATEAYKSAGYKVLNAATAKACGQRLLTDATVKARIAEICSEIATRRQQEAVTLIKREICDKQNRVDALQDRWQRLARVIEARSQDEELRKVPGGDTGLLVITKYQRKTYFGTDPKTGEQVRMTDLVPEYAVDTGLLREMRAHEEQASRELGQWVEKQDVTLKAQVATVSVTLAQAYSAEELRAMEARLLAAAVQKALPQPEAGAGEQGGSSTVQGS